MITIGKNILENLTTGMYSDSKVAYREYIQNACDQIDKAIRQGIITEEEAKETGVNIFIDAEKRYISIKDNATGVKAEEFYSNLGDIANSNKEQGKDKGFRGIGRLCGLAYCKELRFTASAKGENIKSLIIYNAEKMRQMLRDTQKYSIDEILSEIMKFETFEEDVNEHYFKVELIDINKENTDLLDARKVVEYLSFVAPVPYKREFILNHQIYDYAKSIDYKIDEYSIYINGEQVLKEYTSKLKDKSGNNVVNYDEISKLEFKNIYNKDELIAWMWVGLSKFEKSIPKNNVMRGIRARQSNIQIGNEDVFQSLFKETRGNYYFVGEVFTVSGNLIANSQRDYFNETETRIVFEDGLREYFYNELHKLYYSANEIKNANKKQETFITKAKELEEKSKQNDFIDDREKEKLIEEVEKAKDEAEKATKKLEKYSDVDKNSPIAEVKKQIDRKFKANTLVTQVKEIDDKKVIEKTKTSKKSSGYAVDVLSKLDKSDRKLVSKIWSIITDNAPKEVAEQIIEKIKEEFK